MEKNDPRPTTVTIKSSGFKGWAQVRDGCSEEEMLELRSERGRFFSSFTRFSGYHVGREPEAQGEQGARGTEKRLVLLKLGD